MTAIGHREPFHQSKDWYAAHALLGNRADEHVCSPRDVEWIAIEPCKKHHVASANGHKLKQDRGNGQVLYQRERSMRHVHLVARISWTVSGGQSSKPLRVGMLDQTKKCVYQCKLVAPAEAQVNFWDIVRQSHNEQMLRS